MWGPGFFLRAWCFVLSPCILRGVASARGEVLLQEVAGKKAVMMQGAESLWQGECVRTLNQHVRRKGLFMLKYMWTLDSLERLPLLFSSCFKQQGLSVRGSIFQGQSLHYQDEIKEIILNLFKKMLYSVLFCLLIQCPVFIVFTFLSTFHHFLSHYPLWISVWIGYC